MFNYHRGESQNDASEPKVSQWYGSKNVHQTHIRQFLFRRIIWIKNQVQCHNNMSFI